MDKLSPFLKKIGWPVLIGLALVIIFIAVIVLVWGMKDTPPFYPMIDSMSGYGAPSQGMMLKDSGEINLYSNIRSSSEGVLTQRKIIKNGSLSVLVKKVEETAEKIQSIASNLDGFVSDSQIYESLPGVKAGTVTIRVPANKFDEAILQIKKLVVKVETENINIQDVSEQFTDLEAQLKNSRAEEDQYLEIMKKAKTVEEILNVSQKLSEVRGRIESIQGQIKYLSRQVDMSSITVQLTSEAEVEVFGISWRPLFVIKKAFHNMLSGFASYASGIIWFVFIIPILILWIATIFVIGMIIWKIGRWIRKRV